MATTPTAPTWIDLRSANGHLLARYDRKRRLLHFRTRGRDCIIDLQMVDAQPD